MRIGYIHLDYGEWTLGSYNTQELGLAKAFEELGHQTIIVYWLHSSDSKCFTEIRLTENIRKVYLPYKYRLGHHAIVDLNLLKTYNIDLWHLQCDNLLYVPQAIDYCLKRGISHYCYVGTIESYSHNFMVRCTMNLFSIRNVKAFKRTLVFTKTPAVEQYLKLKGVKNVHTVPVGLDLSVIPQKKGIDTNILSELNIAVDKKYVLLVCALRKDKHPFDILHLSEKLGDDYVIIHIGIGPLENEYKNILFHSSKYSNVKYIGKISNHQIHDYYKLAQYVVNLNPNEIFGMSILEAMFHNCTVVAINAPGPSSIIENGVSGFLVDSVDEMANIILSGKKVISAKNRVLSDFTWNKSVAKILSYFR